MSKSDEFVGNDVLKRQIDMLAAELAGGADLNRLRDLLTGFAFAVKASTLRDIGNCLGK